MFDQYQNKAMSDLENKDLLMVGKVKRKKLKLNAQLKSYAKGSILDIEVDAKGVPLERYWRDRVKDAKIDNCVEFIKGANK